MKKFIDRVTTQILDETSLNDLHKIKLVLPSIRSINQVKKSLLNKVDSACILPEITTINEFIISTSKRSLISSLDAQLCLINLLKKIDSENYFNDNLFEVISKLKNENYDLIIDLHNNLRSNYIKFKLGKPSYTYKKQFIKRWLYTNFKIPLRINHITNSYINCLSKLNIVDENAGDIELP